MTYTAKDNSADIAKIYDEWHQKLPENEQRWCDYHIEMLTKKFKNFGPQSAKELIVRGLLCKNGNVREK